MNRAGHSGARHLRAPPDHESTLNSADRASGALGSGQRAWAGRGSSTVTGAPRSHSWRSELRSASTRPPQMPCWPAPLQVRSDNSRHSARTGHTAHTASARAASARSRAGLAAMETTRLDRESCPRTPPGGWPRNSAVPRQSARPGRRPHPVGARWSWCASSALPPDMAGIATALDTAWPSGLSGTSSRWVVPAVLCPPSRARRARHPWPGAHTTSQSGDAPLAVLGQHRSSRQVPQAP